YRGFWASKTGDFRTALETLERAESGARRLGLEDDELLAASLRAPLLGLVGRYREQSDIVARILELTITADDQEPCSTALYLNNAGWALLLARGTARRDDVAGRVIERALAFYANGGGCKPDVGHDASRVLQEVRINYALEALTRSDWRSAEERVE